MFNIHGVHKFPKGLLFVLTSIWIDHVSTGVFESGGALLTLHIYTLILHEAWSRQNDNISSPKQWHHIPGCNRFSYLEMLQPSFLNSNNAVKLIVR